jgi:hypothetical protein
MARAAVPAAARRSATLLAMTSSRRAAVPVLLALVLLTAGCGDGAGGSSATASSSAAGAASTLPDEPGGEPVDDPDGAADDDTADDGDEGAPPFTANTEPDTADASAGSLVGVTDVRIGRHDGFDRVVLEVGGEGTPGWDVRYVDAPASQGSGDAVAVAGEAVLQVTVTGTGYPGDTGVQEWAAAAPLRSGDTEVVTEVVWDGTYEGTSVAFVGTAARSPFRVYLLDGPTRVVLEVAHAG